MESSANNQNKHRTCFIITVFVKQNDGTISDLCVSSHIPFVKQA